MKTKKKVLLATLATLCLSTASVGGAIICASAADTNPTVFKAVDGASVKIMTDKTDSGIRFSYMMEQEYYNSLLNEGAFKDGVSVTAYIVPTDLVSEKTADAIIADTDTAKRVINADRWKVYQVVEGENLVDYVDENGDKWMISYSYLYNLPAASYARSISAVAQVVDGTNTYTSDVESRSMAEVANNLLYINNWTGEGSEILKEYLAGYLYNLSLNKTSVNLLYSETANVKNTVTLTANTNMQTAITWASDNEDVATVVDGVVTAVGKGTANITATVTASGETATCAVIVQNYYTISSVADFWAIENDMGGYYVLTQDIDFSGETPRIALGAISGKGDVGVCTVFSGTFDGQGYALKNFTTKGVQGGILQAVFGNVTGAIKNVYVDMMQGTTGSVKGLAFISKTTGATVENVFVKLKAFNAAYAGGGNGQPTAPLISTITNGTKVNNCVAVLDATEMTTHVDSGNYAALVGYGNGANNVVTNSYGVHLAGNSAATAANTHKKDATITNSSVVTSLSDLYTAISVSGVLTAENGWNMNVWKIENGVLTFGDEVIYTQA